MFLEITYTVEKNHYGYFKMHRSTTFLVTIAVDANIEESKRSRD